MIRPSTSWMIPSSRRTARLSDGVIRKDSFFPAARELRAEGGHVSGTSERAVLDAVGLVRGGAQALLPVRLVVLVVAGEPRRLAVPFERQDVRGNAIEEPAIVADDDGAAGKFEQRIFQRAQR